MKAILYRQTWQAVQRTLNQGRVVFKHNLTNSLMSKLILLLLSLAFIAIVPAAHAQADPDNPIARAQRPRSEPGHGPGWPKISIHPPPSQITSWNAYSWQFIDAPVFRLLPIPETVEYRAVVRQGDKTCTVRAKTPRLDLAKIWRKLRTKKFSLTIEWVDKNGKIICSESRDRVKAPDFKGFNEPMDNWAAAADRNIAFLIDDATNSPAPYREPGVPAWIWNATRSHPTSYPCITINAMTWGFLGHVENQGPQSVEAMRLARVGADWVLEHRQPDSGALPLFPYSTVSKGKFGGNVEGDSVNLLRASWLAISFVDLYLVTQHEPYLTYARHIADTTVKFQNADGSFPYRLNPKTGAVVEQYTPTAMEFVELVEKLAPLGYDARRAMAAQRAVEWMLAYVCTTHNWKGTFEDVGEQKFYVNLSHFGAQQLIRYLCQHKDANPDYLPTAIRLNRWVEDQFVTFGPENEASPVRVKGPLLFEQFVCFWPMEAHAGNWIFSLIELHKATGKKVYLDKAKAAANAICAQQYPDGQFTTWGRDYETGICPVDNHGDRAVNSWYNCNAYTDCALYKLTLYVKSLR